MEERYYKLPLNMTALLGDDTDQSYLDSCTEKESIYRYVHLLISTCPGEHDFDKTFGTKIFDMDFEKIVSLTRWEMQFTQFITEAIIKNEKRLENVDVRVQIEDSTRQDSIFGTSTIKKRALVSVSANLLRTGEQCNFSYVLYLGPLSTK